MAGDGRDISGDIHTVWLVYFIFKPSNLLSKVSMFHAITIVLIKGCIFNWFLLKLKNIFSGNNCVYFGGDIFVKKLTKNLIYERYLKQIQSLGGVIEKFKVLTE